VAVVHRTTPLASALNLGSRRSIGSRWARRCLPRCLPELVPGGDRRGRRDPRRRATGHELPPRPGKPGAAQGLPCSRHGARDRSARGPGRLQLSRVMPGDPQVGAHKLAAASRPEPRPSATRSVCSWCTAAPRGRSAAVIRGRLEVPPRRSWTSRVAFVTRPARPSSLAGLLVWTSLRWQHSEETEGEVPAARHASGTRWRAVFRESIQRERLVGSGSKASEAHRSFEPSALDRSAPHLPTHRASS
jgi:hypothetical protein